MADLAARAALLESSSQDEAITVNQRALIDKILARYAAEFTVFRELLQNADDAGAINCELRFTSQLASSTSNATSASTSSSVDPSSPSSSSPTTPSNPVKLPDFKATLSSWCFKNDGKPFGKDDWSRLRRIAEGNPDPDRIGAFGVGFYSLFSICEEPIVQSGDSLMGFFWKGDSLFTRSAKSPTEELSPSNKPWTSFFMPLREPGQFPDTPLNLARFLATSLTFTTKVKSISLYWDDLRLCKLEKTLSTPIGMNMPNHLNPTSPSRMMRVSTLQETSVRIDSEVMRMVLQTAEKEKPKLLNSLSSAFSKPSTTQGMLSGMLSAFGRKSNTTSSNSTTPIPTASLDSSSNVKDSLESTAKALTAVTASVHLRIASANVTVAVDKAFEREIERSTKKPPPKTTAVQVIFTGKEEYDASLKSSGAVVEEEDGTPVSSGGLESDEDRKGVRQIFEGLMPRVEEQGHVFIGFRTHQQTSFSGHLAARFIPTVERESLDFIDKYCAQWNSELCSIGGYVTRAIYEGELSAIGRLWTEKIGSSRPKEGDVDAKKLLARALHTMQFFTFRTSAPSSRLTKLFEKAFFECARQNTITLMSTRGPKHSKDVRFPNAALAEFVKDLPVLEPNHVKEAGEFVTSVRGRSLLQDITMSDVFGELQGRALPVNEMVACLQWWISVAKHPNYNPSLLSSLIAAAMVTIASPDSKEDPKDATSKIQPLSGVKYFLNSQRIPTDLPLPETCLHYEVSKAFSANDLWTIFGWTELSLPDWISHLIAISSGKEPSTPIETNLQLSPQFSEKVLGVIARAWGSLPAHRQTEVVSLLSTITCIPTRKGMKKPNDSYFANVSLFSDLPIIELPSGSAVKGSLEKVLATLGVRKHVELQLVFDRLVAAGDWSHVELLTYLATNKDSLSKLEWDRLKKTAIFPKSGEVGEPGKDGKPKIIRYRASQLYEPTEALTLLELPTLDWKGKPWRASSEEGKFMATLGLQSHPPLSDLLLRASEASKPTLRVHALNYLFSKHAQVYKKDYSSIAPSFAFVPALVGEEKTPKLCKPSEVVLNKAASVMGFAVVSPEISELELPKLGLRQNPESRSLIRSLVTSPTKDEKLARRKFEYLASVQELSASDYASIRSIAFIPVARKGGKTSSEVDLYPPSSCYFGGQESEFKDCFTFLDFGPEAAVFLRNAGVTNEPSIEEVATKLVSQPERFYALAGGTEAYLGILRRIASSWNRIRSPLRSEMKRSAFLIGHKRIRQAGATLNSANLVDQEDLDDDENDPGLLITELKRPSEIVIADDANSKMLFASSIFVAPAEDLLEQQLYEQLGSPRLSSLMEERCLPVGNLHESTRRALEIKALVLERTPLFLFERKQMGRSEIKHDIDWLKQSLEVVEVDGEGLKLTRILTFNQLRESNVQKSSAMAAMRNGKLILYLAMNLEIDWFEVADSISKFLLSRARLQEVLLFMNLLSTSLRNLKRRGFHVDKILAQRKAERNAAETAAREERVQSELRALEMKGKAADVARWKKEILEIFPDQDEAHLEKLLNSKSSDQVEEVMQDILNGLGKVKQGREVEKARGPEKNPLVPPPNNSSFANEAAGGGGFLSKWKGRFGGSSGTDRNSSLAMGTSSIEFPGGFNQQPNNAISAAARSASQSGSDLGALTGGNDSGQVVRGSPAAQPTSQQDIKSKALEAVRASRPDQSTASITSTAQEQQVKEASSYCDVTGADLDLKLAGEIHGMKIFLSTDLLEPSEMLTQNYESLERLILKIYLPLGKIYGINPEALRVFSDTSGPTIAFNRGGTIWLNFRYYLSWHDQDVKAGRMADPLISTYFSMAHELAHNRISSHDAAHGWWTSSIAETYFTKLAAYIQQVSPSQIP